MSVGCLTLTGTAAPQTAAPVPSPAQAPRTSQGGLTYAQSLVRRERPVGVVLREHELHSTVVTDPNAPRETMVTESGRGAVTRLLSTGAVRCHAALERPIVPLVLRGKPLSVLYDLVMQDATASTRTPPGILGGASPSARSNERLGQQIEMHVNDGDTLGQALDRLASSGVPFGWGIVEQGEASVAACQIILFTEDTVWWTPYDALNPVPPLPTGAR